MQRDYGKFEGAELNIYTTEGQNISVPIDALELAVMLKAIGFNIEDASVSAYGEQTLKNILNGKINPFRLKELP